MTETFKRTYAVEIEFDTPITFAEQDRLACVILEELVEGWWTAARGRVAPLQGNTPDNAIAYLIENKRR